MSLATSLVIGGVVVLVVVGSLVFLARKGYFEPDTNTESQEEREDLSESARAEFDIPFRKRVGSWSLPYKVFVGSLGLLVVGSGFVTYQVMKTGSPVQQFLTREVQYGVVSLIGITGGVYLKSWFDSQVGFLDVIYERSGQDNVVERVPYARTNVRRRNGEVTIPEIESNRLMGLFWRFRQVGEDRRLRGGEKPLDDVITHKIPDHGEEIPDGSGYVVKTREGGDEILSGATSTADVTYASPNSLSDERATQIREQKRRKEAELQAVKATNAELYKQIRKMRKKIENEEYDSRQDLIRDFREFADMTSTLKVDINESRNGSPSTSDDGEESTEAKA